MDGQKLEIRPILSDYYCTKPRPAKSRVICHRNRPCGWTWLPVSRRNAGDAREQVVFLKGRFLRTFFGRHYSFQGTISDQRIFNNNNHIEKTAIIGIVGIVITQI